MLRSLRRPGVLPSIMLVIIILWALLAVLMLTNTLVNAGQIDDRVEVINGEVAPIDNELDAVALAKTTGEISTGIDKAAGPLTGQLTETNNSVRNIDADAEKILATAKTINGTVKEINPTVLTINDNVNSIGSALTSVEGNVLAINDSVNGINGSFTGVIDMVFSIDDRVAAINRRADVIIGHSQGIAANLTRVDEELVPDINSNAAAIRERLLGGAMNGGDVAFLNQLAATRALPPAPTGLQPVVPDVAKLPAPVQLPQLPDTGVPLLGAQPQQSPDRDTGSLLGSVTGGL